MNRFARPLTRLGLLLLLGAALGGAAGGQLGLSKTTVTGSYLAGQQALKDLRTEDAAQFFGSAVEAGWTNPSVVAGAVVAYVDDGNIEQGAATARHLLELDSDNEIAKLVLGAEALKQRRYAAVEKELSELGTDTFAGVTGAVVRAWAFVGDKRYNEAAKLLDGIADQGLEEFLVFHRALMADVAGRSDTALEFGKRAYEGDRLSARVVEAYTRILGNAGRFDEAAAVLKTFTDQGLDYPLIDPVKAAIDAKRRPGLFAESVQTGAAEMFHGMGVALARDGGPEMSLLFLRLGQYLNPQSDVIKLVIGQVLDRAEQHDAANALYNNVPPSSPLRDTAVVRVAENLEATGQREEAIRRLGNIVTANPKDVDALSSLGDLQRAAEHYADAAGTYTQALDLVGTEKPASWRFYYVRGIAYERDKRWPQAEADFLKALELNPDQPQVLNYLGYSWVDQGLNLDRALGMIQKAVAASPGDGYIIDSLGWAFYRLGRYTDAVQALEQAVQLRPRDPEINDHLGDAYWRAGRKLEAKFQWNVAASVDKEGNVKERVAPKLANGLDAAPADPDAAPVVAKDPAPVAQTESPATPQ